jgi:hypothetical protein
MERYLSADQCEVEYRKDAEQFKDLDVAEKAADAYMRIAKACWPCPPMIFVEDMDEEPRD